MPNSDVTMGRSADLTQKDEVQVPVTPSVGNNHTEKASETPPAEGTAARVIWDEKVAIEKNRALRLKDTPSAPWCGLGLSGGGIRSASLGLGVLQALAEKDLLKNFDYISSVSGGGYIASSLQWWWHRPREDMPDRNTTIVTFGVGPDDFPYGPARQPIAAQNNIPPAKADSNIGQTGTRAAAAAPTPPGEEKSLIDSVRGEQTIAERAEKNISFLRAHSSYLTPGNGLSLWSILGVLLRTVTISLLTWIPIFTFFFVLMIYLGYLVNFAAESVNLVWPFQSWIPAQWIPPEPRELAWVMQYPAIYALGLLAFLVISVLFIGAAILFAFVSRAPQDPHRRGATIARHTIGGIAAACVVWFILKTYSSIDLLMLLIAIGGCIYIAVAILIVASELITTRSLNASYWVRRSIERIMGTLFLPTIALLVSSTIPVLPFYAWQNASSATHLTISGLAGLLSGIGSALYGYYTFLRNIVPSLAGQIVATAGAIIYLYMTVVIAYVLAIFVVYYRFLPFDRSDWLFDGLVATIVIGFSIGFIANVNYVGFHRFYRDRLIEAFMPTDFSVSRVQANYSPVADNLSIADLAKSFGVSDETNDQDLADVGPYKPHPYPLINTNAILVNDDDQKFASRGGDNFVISPLYIGSNATGWQRTCEHIKRNGPFTLASAMAASGAAANASAGYIGTGITMNPLVSIVMSLLNIRLGLWVGNPFHRAARNVRTIPTFITAGILPGFFGSLHRKESTFLELTDGGHFENLGLYELVRRKLEIILIVDGEEDPTISLSSLVSATRRIEQDFGTRLSFVSGKGPERFVMAALERSYPSAARYAEAPFLVGKLIYNEKQSGTLIYVKATNIKDMDFMTAGYLAANPTFPHQTTANQFFVPDQFDAYRLLGYESAIRMIGDLNLTAKILDPAGILNEYNPPS